MPITKATRDVIDLSVRPVTAIDMNCADNVNNRVDNTRIGTRVANEGHFTNVDLDDLTFNANGQLDVSASGVTVVGKLRAYYADIAEYYEADAYYPEGTILEFGGTKEVTLCKEPFSHRFIGVVSSNPFIVLNQELAEQTEFPTQIGLIGRVPCKVIGSVKAGDYIVVSEMPGVGKAAIGAVTNEICVGRVIKTDSDTHERIVEIKVG